MGWMILRGEKHEVDREKMSNRELMDMERVTGWTTGEWEDQFNNGSMLALTALVYVVLKRQDPNLRFDDVDFELRDIDFEADADEEPGKAVAAKAAPSRKKSTST